MKILVLSDTHSDPLPSQVMADVQKADMVVHTGDFCDKELYDALKGLKEVHCVYGNMDGLALRKLMPRKTVFSCEGVNIGLVHGDGGYEAVLDRVRAAFQGEKVQAVVFGHSHEPFNKVIDGVLYFNPGSPTDMVRAPYRSYGVLEVAGGKIKGSIVRIK